jgi:hypothetical protein
MFVSSVHYYAGEEQKSDPALIKLRVKFARFCLDRLKPDPSTGASVERDPHWRKAYVEAVRKLCVNPDGRGHRILHQIVLHDPDPVLREIAKIAYVELRRGPNLPKGLSPRRVILQAFLELRRGHLLALGCAVDESGSQRTSEQEARRTTEPREEVISQ